MSSSETRNDLDAKRGPRDFASRLVAWQARQGRHDLPWQVKDPYCIWVSEIMLQQTQVETVIPYYRRFITTFPSVEAMAEANEDSVLALWSGLGYYSRARNLHAAARRIVSDFAGRFPQRFDDLLALPGIGRSTAAAIAAFAWNERRAILDGNVKRVLCRAFGIEGWPGESAVEQRLWQLAEALLPQSGMAAYTQGLMDLGASLCRRTRPDCDACPFDEDCVARRAGRQAELPMSRPRKPLLERETTMLILLNRSEVLLEKRPSSGIWGGLWSLPECAASADAVTEARRLGYEAEALAPLPTLLHNFSHFRLRIAPQPLSISQRPLRAEVPGRLWLPLDDAAGAAVPTPVRKIIQVLGELA